MQVKINVSLTNNSIVVITRCFIIINMSDPVDSIMNMNKMDIESCMDPRVEEIMDYFNRCPAPLPSLSDILLKNGAVVAGSFLFRFVMNSYEDHFVPDNLDIFIATYTHYEIIRIFEKCGWKMESDSVLIPYVLGSAACVRYSLLSPSPECHPRKVNIHCYRNFGSYGNYFQNDSRVEHMSVEERLFRVKESIDKHFDLNGCTLKWDGGDHLHASDDLNAGEFIHQHIMSVRIQNLCQEPISNIQEFRHRWIHLSCGNSLQLTMNQLNEKFDRVVYNRILERIQKYKDRGFIIKNEHEVHLAFSHLNCSLCVKLPTSPD